MNSERPRTDDTIQVAVSSDKMRATLHLSSDVQITEEQINQLLQAHDIRFGLIHSAIRELVAGKHRNIDHLVAKGRAPINGKDALFHYEIREDHQATRDEKDRADYYNIHFIYDIHAGDLLATITPATQGLPGMNVLGEKLEQTSGNPHPEFTLRAGGGTTCRDNQIVAAIDGVYNKDPQGVINLLDKVVIQHDVDFSCGNIDTLVDVEILGDVLSGFKVHSKRNIKVHGSVENAEVTAGGNLKVVKGIVGSLQNISAGGTLTAKYIKHCNHVQAQVIEVEDRIEMSSLYAGASLSCRQIIGGVTRCRSQINAEEIGSISGTETEIEMGLDPLLQMQIDEIASQMDVAQGHIAIAEREIEKLDRDIEAIYEMIGKMRDGSKGHSKELVSNLEQKVLEQNEDADKQYQKKEEQSARLEELRRKHDELVELQTLQSPEILVSKNIFSDVSVRIGEKEFWESLLDTGPLRIYFFDDKIHTESLRKQR